MSPPSRRSDGIMFETKRPGVGVDTGPFYLGGPGWMKQLVRRR